MIHPKKRRRLRAQCFGLFRLVELNQVQLFGFSKKKKKKKRFNFLNFLRTKIFYFVDDVCVPY